MAAPSRPLFFFFVLVAGCVAVAASAQTHGLKTHRLAGSDYVAVTELVRHYNLGRNLSGDFARAEYRTSSAHLAVQAERREVRINGVRHWLSAPVLGARDRLWVKELDLIKTIDPILRPQKRRPGTPIRTIVLDPGHGGSDRGAKGRSGTEKTLTLDLARRVKRHLEKNGVRVLLTRSSDRTVPLEDRVQFCKSKKADVFVSLHFNSGGAAASGIETYCLPPAGAPATADVRARRHFVRAPGNRHDDHNVLLAHLVQQSLLRATGACDRGVRRARFYVLRYASCPAILVEAGFLSNRAEEQRIVKADYREAMARAIAEGILAYKRSVDTP